MRSIRKTRTRGGWTVVDALVGTAVVAVVGAALAPMLGTGMHRSGMMVSANNLRRLGQGHAAYEATWNGQQHTTMVAEMGLYSGSNACGAFLQNHCPPPAPVIGTDPHGRTWGFFWNGSLPACTAYPGGSPFCSGGTTSRFPALSVPLAVGGTSGAFSGIPIQDGNYWLPNMRGVREYVCERFFDPVFTSPNDLVAYPRLASAFASTAEVADINLLDNDTTSSTYCTSAAALWNPCVFRAPSQGGFQAPGTCADAYRTPSANAVTYPTLKTRMMEWRMCQGPRGAVSPVLAGGVMDAFNAHPGSRPGAVFFDGHVSFTAMADYAADDAQVLQQTGTDGLWSRDSGLGANGYRGQAAQSGFRASPHFLTTGGIAGRDLLHAR
ncbi:MAG: hypothetical protein FJ260_10910 [Planctomycetes bacterium]|nr:hypothetical protein [Planctomycetota bacterium]